MYYICKVLTPAFQMAVNKFLDEVSKTESSRIKWRYSLNVLWNSKKDTEALALLRAQLPEIIRQPNYKTQCFEAMELGFQRQPRIQWKKDILKIEDIDEIFSYYKSETIPSPEPVIPYHLLDQE